VTTYPSAESDRIVPADALRAVVGTVFERRDMVREDAALLADSLVAADPRGVHSHGVPRVGGSIEQRVCRRNRAPGEIVQISDGCMGRHQLGGATVCGR